MLATIWTCTQEWSLISRRTTAFTFATCHQALIWSSASIRSSTLRSFRFPRGGHAQVHPGDGLGGREQRRVRALERERLLDHLVGVVLGLHPGSLDGARVRPRPRPSRRTAACTCRRRP